MSRTIPRRQPKPNDSMMRDRNGSQIDQNRLNSSRRDMTDQLLGFENDNSSNGLTASVLRTMSHV